MSRRKDGKCCACGAPLPPERNHPYCLECKRSYGRAYYRNNAARVISANARWAERNRERHLQMQRDWRERNREHVREYERSRRRSAAERDALWMAREREERAA